MIPLQTRGGCSSRGFSRRLKQATKVAATLIRQQEMQQKPANATFSFPGLIAINNDKIFTVPFEVNPAEKYVFDV